MPYDPNLVQPMRDELTRIGAQELTNPGEVEAFFSQKTGTSLLVINSVCGCAAAGARPAVQLALRSEVKPDRVGTVFAGQDVEATHQARSHIPHIPPSSPSFALFKEGELVHLVPRHLIEGRDGREVAANLVEAFRKHCETGAVAG